MRAVKKPRACEISFSSQLRNLAATHFILKSKPIKVNGWQNNKTRKTLNPIATSFR